MEQVTLIPDQRPVEELTAADLHPPFRDRIHCRHPDSGHYDLEARIGHDGVEPCGELAVSVADQEPCPASGVFQVHDQVPGGLGHPGRGRVCGRTHDADPAGAVLDPQGGGL